MKVRVPLLVSFVAHFEFGSEDRWMHFKPELLKKNSGNLLPRLSNITESDRAYPERVFLKKVVKSSGIYNNTDFAKAAIKFEYFKNYPLSDVSELRDEYISLHSDFSVVAPVYKTAVYFSKRTKVYFYTFEYEGEHSFSQILMQAPDREPREPASRKKRQTSVFSTDDDLAPAAVDKLLEITPEVVEQLEKIGGEAFHFDDHHRTFQNFVITYKHFKHFKHL